ncbi:hypothetical protein E2562_015248 [Oryza meyeriana var. granulata]|uniref:Uncharacterized protein n=1 Tax=Oryza meyeriana var. granulata TaxID=110450 RepID=A0A6G1DJH5_9ORYZ|nr:hypothetical protein E2562_015248 [Oryza meyeriana var. granulata]
MAGVGVAKSVSFGRGRSGQSAAATSTDKISRKCCSASFGHQHESDHVNVVSQAKKQFSPHQESGKGTLV